MNPALAALLEGRTAAFLLVLTRAGGVMALAPLFGSNNVPPLTKTGLSALLALLLLPSAGAAPLMSSPADAALALGREFTVGALLGLASYFVFVAAQLAGQIVDIQMGFGIVNVIDPVSSAQVSVMGQFQFLVATLAFLAVDGPHLVISGLAESFRYAPLGAATLPAGGLETLLRISGDFFSSAFRLSAPAVAALLLTNLAMGVLARTVPQMNVFIVGLPVSIAVGLFVMSVSVSFLALTLGSAMTTKIPQDMTAIMRVLR